MTATLASDVLVVIFVVVLLISKTLLFFFGTHGLFMVCEKVEEKLFLIGKIPKSIHNL